jgi:hypothetical protein
MPKPHRNKIAIAEIELPQDVGARLADERISRTEYL